MESMDSVLVYLKTRVYVIDNLIEVHGLPGCEFLTMERSVCVGQLDLLHRFQKAAEEQNEEQINRA